jgi:RNA recognition motif-containing protein
MNIYVSNLGFNVQDEDLKEFFTPYGEVTSAKIINDRESGRSRGFGFVEMPDDAAAQKAIAELNDASVEGRTIKVMEAKPKKTVLQEAAVEVVATAITTQAVAEVATKRSGKPFNKKSEAPYGAFFMQV